MKRNADKLLAIVQQRDLLQQQLATAQTAPAAKAILASVWKRDPDDVKRDADKLLAIVQQRDLLSAQIDDAKNVLSKQEVEISEFGFLDNYVAQGKSLDRIELTTEGGCLSSCAARPDCAGFTYDKPTSVCRLRSKVNNLHQEPNAFSGLRSPPSLPSPPLPVDIEIEPW